MLKVYILIIVVGFVGSVAYGGYYYYKDTQQRIQILTENSAKLETATKLQKNTIDTLQADAEKYAEATFKQKKEETGTYLEKEVDVLVCSLCESNKFFLVNDDKRTVGCSNCGYLTSTHWIIPDGQ